jgi:Zn ribbon nucleic-acid-binding protein
MIALYNKRLKELEGNPAELYQYMSKAAPYIMSYETNKNKKDILTEYIAVVEEGCAITISDAIVDSSKCLKCDSLNLFYDDNSSDLICLSCGFASYEAGCERSYKEEQDTEPTTQYSYKKENHFNEWIAQFQAREVTNVPNDVFESLRSEFKKRRIPKGDITHSKVRESLKKLGLTKYYEHVPYIASYMSGIKPPTMSIELEEKLRHMFYMIQQPFLKHRPENRKNFLSYSYILYKFCELLSEDSFLPCFPLLKSKEKLYAQDLIWREICKDLQWEFIATV